MRKQTDTLNDIADIAAQLILIHLANSLILHIDFALIRNQKTIDQLQNGCLPASASTDYTDKLPVLNIHTEILQDSMLSIGVDDMLHSYAAHFVTSRSCFFTRKSLATSASFLPLVSTSLFISAISFSVICPFNSSRTLRSWGYVASVSSRTTVPA